MNGAFENSIGSLQGQRMEAIGRLAGGVAHDFNNLLTVIAGYTQLLLDDIAVQDDIKPVLRDISDAAQRAGDLTRQLLAFSRRQTIQAVEVDINDRVANMQSLLGRVIGEHIDLRTELNPQAGCSKVDPSQFDQVLLNLVVNARDAMPHGGVVTVRTCVVTVGEPLTVAGALVPAGTYVKVSVTDTGAGMTPEVLGHIFEPFFSTKKGLGTGLGLATVYGIVKQHGGFIFADSSIGHGTVFDILLPRVGDEHHAQAENTVFRSAGGSERILLVEDELALRRFAAQTLRRDGYNVTEAANGCEALEILEEFGGTFDLIVTDVVMPQMGGPEMTKEATKRWPGLRVLFTSGYIDEAMGQSRSLQAGTQFLPKPFTARLLGAKVREILDEAVHKV